MSDRPRQLYVLIGHQRTGSHFIGSMLRSVPDIFQYDEVMMPTFSGNYGGEGLFFAFYKRLLENDWNNLLVTDNTIFDRLFRKFFDEMSGSVEERIVGFDIKIDQISFYPRLYWMLQQWGFKIVHIVRRNYLERLVSHHIMNLRVSSGEVDIHAQKQKDVRLTLDVQGSIDWMMSDKGGNDFIERTFSQSAGRYLKVFYEDVAETQNVDNILEFLGSDFLGRASSDVKKQATKPLQETVENYHEIMNEIHRRNLGAVLGID